MKILVIHHKFRLFDRRTITDHLYSFKRYLKNDEIIYWNIGNELYLTKLMLETDFDIVILHYTFLAQRFSESFFGFYENKLKHIILNLSGIKILIPHDEYIYTQQIREIAKDCKANLIFASCFEEDYETLFPINYIGDQLQIKTVFTGYVDNNLANFLKFKTKKHAQRKLDIVYRALKSPFIFGKHGQLKSDVAERFIEFTDTEPDLKVDIKLTQAGYKNTIVGNKWIKFLLSSRCSLGCLGGSSLMDETGEIKIAVSNFLKSNPKADFDDVKEKCYNGKEGIIKSRLLGPKFFECAITKTCQVLMEADYHGVMQADIDYISVKHDYSNIKDVMKKIKDVNYCQTIADNCYEHVVRSQKYTYKKYAQFVLDTCYSYININKIEKKSDRNIKKLKIFGIRGLQTINCFICVVIKFFKRLFNNLLLKIYGLKKTHYKLYVFMKKTYYFLTFRTYKGDNDNLND